MANRGKIYLARMAVMRAKDLEMAQCSSDRVVDFNGRYEIGEGGCWLWRGSIARSGYGYFFYKPGGKTTAHRFSLILYAGLSPKEGVFYACHKCRNKHCVNPEHLYWGTPKQNVRDAWDDPARRTEEFRLRSQYNEKISNDQIREIWQRYWFSKESLASLASEFECDSSYLMKVINGTYRCHITRYLRKPSSRQRPSSAHAAERNGKALFSNGQVQAIRRLLNNKNMESNLAQALGVAISVVSHIATGITWKDLPWPDGLLPRDAQKTNLYNPKAPIRNVRATRPKNELGRSDIRQIFDRYWHKNEGQRELAIEYGTSNCLVSFIVNKKWGAEHTEDMRENPHRRKRVANSKNPFGGHSKVTPGQLAEVRRYIAAGLDNASIARKYKTMTTDIVRNIRHGKSYKSV
ncbi:MAG: hypothetical protein EOO38_01800 [Cytophagaceae bacterium]|nr:MAG: hypothetical protein EOO38_01800 [Cytophagaceae bacterium]